MIEKIKELLVQLGGTAYFTPPIKIKYTPHSFPILIKKAWEGEDGNIHLFIVEKGDTILTPEQNLYFSSLLSRIYQQLDNKHETN